MIKTHTISILNTPTPTTTPTDDIGVIEPSTANSGISTIHLNVPTPTTTPTDDVDDTEPSSEDGSVPAAVFVAVGGMMMLIVALTLIVVFCLVRKNRQQKDG